MKPIGHFLTFAGTVVMAVFILGLSLIFIFLFVLHLFVEWIFKTPEGAM